MHVRTLQLFTEAYMYYAKREPANFSRGSEVVYKYKIGLLFLDTILHCTCTCVPPKYQQSGFLVLVG